MSKIQFFDDELPRKPSEGHSICPVCNSVFESKVSGCWVICTKCYLSPLHFTLMQKGYIPRGICLQNVRRIG